MGSSLYQSVSVKTFFFHVERRFSLKLQPSSVIVYLTMYFINMEFNTQAELDAYNNSLVETNVRLVGDKTVIGQVVQLLAYIRHAVRNNMKVKIDVNIANTVANVPFMMDVNGLEVPDLVTVKKTQIN